MIVTRANTYEILSAPERESDLLPFGTAAICLNDDTVFHLSDRRCPVCGSEQFTLLARPAREGSR